MLASQVARSARTDAPSKGRILVVDDDELMLRALRRLLNVDGFAVEVAQSGDAAEVLLSKSAFDLLLTDIHMPGLDGLGLLALSRERHPDLPVVLLTGMPEVQTAMKAIEHG